jgi:hypothetical protein
MTMTDEQKKEQIKALAEAAKEQREYERKRSILMDESVLIVTMLKQRLQNGPGIAPIAPITGDGQLLAAAQIYAGFILGDAKP